MYFVYKRPYSINKKVKYLNLCLEKREPGAEKFICLKPAYLACWSTCWRVAFFSRLISLMCTALLHCIIHSNNTIKRKSRSSSNPCPLCMTALFSLTKLRKEGVLLSPFIQKMATPHHWEKEFKKCNSQTCTTFFIIVFYQNLEC